MIDGDLLLRSSAARADRGVFQERTFLKSAARFGMVGSCSEKFEYVDRICVTSDDDVLGVARSFSDVDIITRPTQMASDTAKVEDAILHAVTSLEDRFDLLVLLQPTSPLRTGEDIDGAIATCGGRCTGCDQRDRARKFPYWMCTKRRWNARKTYSDRSGHHRAKICQRYCV